VERAFAVVAWEVRAWRAQRVPAPVTDVASDPRWGRIEETYGEHPHLVARMGLAAVRGLHGDGRTISARHVRSTPLAAFVPRGPRFGRL
jgi:beta-glucosidase